jgi:hypothetical protein
VGAGMTTLDIAAARLIRAMKREQGVQFFRARLGRRRSFLSQRDADQYDAGFDSFVSLSDPPPLEYGPFADGWFDHFSDAEEDAMASLETASDGVGDDE